MTSVQVAKLRLQCDVRERDRVRFAIEDGLRTTIPDDRRLVLLRRMRVVGRMAAASPAQRQAAMRTGWLAAVDGARHGSEDGAADANCVWFASHEEAEALLLARLLAGRGMQGWFWKLAVPGWTGQPVRTWLRETIAGVLAANEGPRLLTVVECCLNAGAGDLLVEVLADPTVAGAPAWWHESDARQMPSPRDARAPSEQDEAAPVPSEQAMVLPPALRVTVARLLRAPGGAPRVATRLVRAWVLRRSPALALSQTLLARILTATLDEVRQGRPSAEHPGNTVEPPQDQVDRGAATTDRQSDIRNGFSHPRRTRAATPHALVPTSASSPAAAPRVNGETFEAAAPLAFRNSRHAGLWLVIPSLTRLGIREWLAGRPALLAQDPGAMLLHAIARHYSVAADDPALLALAPAPDPGQLPEWLGWWRHGLDRWLRRTARRRLHDLVHRPGELSWDDWRVDIRYPGGAADIALRRHALDRDPGWTDWLGLSVRYQFGGREDWL
jgi:hypothetical protein